MAQPFPNAKSLWKRWSMRGPKYADIECPNCGTIHRDVPVDIDEDGYPCYDLDTEPCHADDCTRRLCADCERFTCYYCGLPHCWEHVVKRNGLLLCPICVEKIQEVA